MKRGGGGDGERKEKDRERREIWGRMEEEGA